MANPNLDEDEPPPDPVLLRVQARVRRLVLFGGLTLGLGVVAVLVAIIYRFFIMEPGGGVATIGEPIVGEVTAEAVGLAPTAVLAEATIEGDVMLLVFRDGNDTVTVEVDRRTMRHLRTFRITGAP